MWGNGIIVATNKNEYTIGEDIHVKITSILSNDAWITTRCKTPFFLMKAHNSQWINIDMHATRRCYSGPEKIVPYGELNYTFNSLPYETGTYRLEVEYEYIDPSIRSPQEDLKSFSNEFSLNNCSTNSECSFYNRQNQEPIMYGFCLDGVCVQSCNPEEYVRECR